MSFQRQCSDNTSSTSCVNGGFYWLMQQETCLLLIIWLNWNVWRTFLGKLFNFQKELVQCLCLTSDREVISRHQHLRLGHWFLLETFWAVFAEVSNATTAEASRPSANLLNIWRWRLRIGTLAEIAVSLDHVHLLSRLLPSDQSSYCLFFIDRTWLLGRVAQRLEVRDQDIHLRSRLFFKRHQRLIKIVHDVNKFLGHTQIDRKSETKSLSNVSLRVRLSCSCQFPTLARTTSRNIK